MRTIYKTEDDKEFEDKGKALAYEKLKREKVIIPTSVITFENPFYGALLKNVTYLGNINDFKALDTTYVYEGETYDWYSGSVFKTLHCLDGDIVYE